MSTVTEPVQVEPTRDELLEELRTAALDHAAFVDADVLRAVAERVAEHARGTEPNDEGLPAVLQAFVDLVAVRSHETSPEDMERLRQAGYDEETIFEIVVAASVAAGMARLDMGLAAIADAVDRGRT